MIAVSLFDASSHQLDYAFLIGWPQLRHYFVSVLVLVPFLLNRVYQVDRTEGFALVVGKLDEHLAPDRLPVSHSFTIPYDCLSLGV